MPFGGWGWLGLSVFVYAGIGLAFHQPFHDGAQSLKFFDLRVYVDGARRVIDGRGLYSSPMIGRFGFTYPPFAALLFVPLTSLPVWVDELLVTVINLGLLMWLIRRTAFIQAAAHPAGTGRATAGRRATAGPRATSTLLPEYCSWSHAAGIAAAAMWLEPISVTLGYGQVDLLIVALVVFDISLPDRARGKGIAIGIAAGLKLTPLIFIPYLLLSRRHRAALIATATFAATVAISYLATWGDASRYWTGGLILDSSRIGNFRDDANQSLQGVLSRLAPGAGPNTGWHLAAAALAIAGVLLAVRYSRRGDEAAGFSIAALTALLVSPVSWTHHWTLAVPALLLLVRRAQTRRSTRLTRAAAAVALIGFAYLPERWEGHFPPFGVLSPLASAYVLAAFVALLWAAASSRPARLLGARSG